MSLAAWWKDFLQGPRQLKLEDESRRLGVSPGDIVNFMAAQGIHFKTFQVDDYRNRPVVDVPDRSECAQRLAECMAKARAETERLVAENRALKSIPRDDDDEPALKAQSDMEDAARAANIPVPPPQPAPYVPPEVQPMKPKPRRQEMAAKEEKTLRDVLAEKFQPRRKAVEGSDEEPDNDDDDEWKNSGMRIQCRICGKETYLAHTRTAKKIQ